MDSQQIISVYATQMQVRVKEYQLNKNSLICTVYTPEQYQKTILIFQYGAKFLPLVKTEDMHSILTMEEMLGKVASREPCDY